MATSRLTILLAAGAVGTLAAALPAIGQDFSGETANCEGVTFDRIGYSPLTMEFDYFQFIEQGVKQIAEQCKVEVVTADPRVDATKQVSDIESMVSGGAKVIAAVSVFEGADVSVGISDHEFGYSQCVLAGPVLAKREPGKETSKVAILNADSLGPNQLDRKEGLIDGLKQGVTNFEVVADVEAWAEDTALSAVETILQTLPDLDLILTVADGKAGGYEVVVRLPDTVPDGIAIDREGGVWIACYAPDRIYRLAPGGGLETAFDDWQRMALNAPTNLAFAGAALDRLVIASLGGYSLTQADVGVRGAGLNYPTVGS